MLFYQYQARDPQGQLHAGQIEAVSVTAAIDQLAKAGLEIMAISLTDQAEVAQPDSVNSDPPASGQRAEFLRRLDAILNRRDSLVQVLEAIAAEKSFVAGNHLEYVIKRIKTGLTAEQFLSDPQLVIWLPVIAAGHDPALLERQYARWTTQVANQQQRARAWWFALSYPLFLIVCAALMLVPIYVLIVPGFKKMFTEFGLRLPLPTMLMIRISDAILGYPWALALGFVTLLILIFLWLRYWNSLSATTHIFGIFTAGNNPNLLAMSRMTGVLAELLDLGAPLSEALVVAGSASRFAFYRQVCHRLASEIRLDADSWRRSSVRQSLPATLWLALFPSSGSSPSVPLLRELSEIYGERTRYRLQMNAGLATPVLVCMVGATIAFVVISLFLPLVQMVTSLT